MSPLRLLLGIYQLYLTSSASRSMDTASFGTDTEEPIGNRIIGGEATDIDAYPSTVKAFMVNHFLDLIDKSPLNRAGLNSVASQWPPSLWRLLYRGEIRLDGRPLLVVAGSTTLWYSPTWQTSNVDYIIPHHFFSFHSMVHDIALLRTSTAFHINRHVTYARIPTEVNHNLFSDYPEKCTVVGWGRTSVSTQMSSGMLRHAKIPLIDNEQCSHFYSHRIHPGQICAGLKEGGVDACQGDSGGPLICNGTQVGLVSWGQGCAVATSPGVYCRIDYYYDWINGTILRNSSDSLISNCSTMFQIVSVALIIHLYHLLH